MRRRIITAANVAVDVTYNSLLVVLDRTSGRERWHFQTVHHDLWDFDLSVGPSLVDGATILALVQTNKQGELFVLDGRTGNLVTDVEEKPVSKGDVPGEH